MPTKWSDEVEAACVRLWSASGRGVWGQATGKEQKVFRQLVNRVYSDPKKADSNADRST
jgi:hypothetical protein